MSEIDNLKQLLLTEKQDTIIGLDDKPKPIFFNLSHIYNKIDGVKRHRRFISNFIDNVVYIMAASIPSVLLPLPLRAKK